MINYSEPLFHKPIAIWDEKKCARLSNKVVKDGLGTPYPFRGFLGNCFGQFYYNGGCIREGKWYQGELIHHPNIPANYEFFYEYTWGWRIRKVNEGLDSAL